MSEPPQGYQQAMLHVIAQASKNLRNVAATLGKSEDAEVRLYRNDIRQLYAFLTSEDRPFIKILAVEASPVDRSVPLELHVYTPDERVGLRIEVQDDDEENYQATWADFGELYLTPPPPDDVAQAEALDTDSDEPGAILDSDFGADEIVMPPPEPLRRAVERLATHVPKAPEKKPISLLRHVSFSLTEDGIRYLSKRWAAGKTTLALDEFTQLVGSRGGQLPLSVFMHTFGPRFGNLDEKWNDVKILTNITME